MLDDIPSDSLHAFIELYNHLFLTVFLGDYVLILLGKICGEFVELFVELFFINKEFGKSRLVGNRERGAVINGLLNRVVIEIAFALLPEITVRIERYPIDRRTGESR